MSHVLVDLKKLESIRKLDFINSGKEGKCYFLNENEVIKVFHILDRNRKIFFEDLKSDNISFPKDIWFYSDFVCAYTMDYLKGYGIHQGFPLELKLEDLKQMYLSIRKIISDYKDILMDDICVENILVDYNKMNFNLIDTSSWYPHDNSFDYNISYFDRSLTYVLLRKNLFWLDSYLDKSESLFNMYRMYKLGRHVPFLEVLGKVQSEVEEKFNPKVKTISDLIIKR